MPRLTGTTVGRDALLLFILGTLLTGSISTRASGLSAISVQECQDGEMTFKDLLSGRGRTEDGSPFSFLESEASDGVKISARTEKRRSTSRAAAVLRKAMRGAKIVARGPRTNNLGQRIGERVIAWFTSKGQDKSRYVLLWTDGSDFHYLESSSLPHLFAFEKKYNR